MSDELARFIDFSSWRGCLTDDEAARVKRDSCVRVFETGAIVRPAGEPHRHWLGVMDGMLKVEVSNDDGDGTTLMCAPQGVWLDGCAMLTDAPRRHQVVAVRRSKVALVPRATFRWMLDQSFAFNRWQLDHLNSRISHYASLLRFQRIGTPAARVAFCVAALAASKHQTKEKAHVQLPQHEIAALSGLSRSTTHRALHELSSQGLVQVAHGSVFVPECEQLALQAYSASLLTDEWC